MLEVFWFVIVFNISFLVGATKTSRLLTGYKTPYWKEIEDYDMQTRSTHRLTVGLAEKSPLDGCGRSSGKLQTRARHGLSSV
jgi:hypothetical protein